MGKRTIDWAAVAEYHEEHPTVSANQLARDCGISQNAARMFKRGEIKIGAEYGTFSRQHMPDYAVEHCRKVRDLIGWLLYGFRRPEVQLDLFEDQG